MWQEAAEFDDEGTTTNATGTAPAETMQADVLRQTSTGRVVYIEVDHAFVDALGAVLHEPVGGLAKRFDAARVGWSTVSGSFGKLREALFEGDKATMLPSTSNVTVAHQDAAPAGLVPSRVPPPPPVTTCCNPGCAWKGHQLGRTTTNGKKRQYRHHAGNQHCRECGTTNCATYCQQCTLCGNCQTLKQTQQQQAQQAQGQIAVRTGTSLPKFKDTVRFIVDSRLNVHENSSIKALELMGKAGIALDDIGTSTVQIDQKVFLDLVCGVFMNKDDVLTPALH